jgi:hypothetical protein
MTIDRTPRARRPDVGEPTKTHWDDLPYDDCFAETLLALMAAGVGGAALCAFVIWLIWGVAW